MGIVFRNGIPYGGTESADVTTVATVADLDLIEDPQENHLYIVKENNRTYRYNATSEEFVNTPTLTDAADNVILVSNGAGQIKQNSIGQFDPFRIETHNFYPLNRQCTSIINKYYTGYFTGIANKGDYNSYSNGIFVGGPSYLIVGDGNDYYGTGQTKFWETSLSGPDIRFQGTAKIQMQGASDPTDTPAIIMRGNTLIDMFAQSTKNFYANYSRTSDNKVIRQGLIPFNTKHGESEKIDINCPILHLHDMATISMEEQTLVEMKNNASCHLKGNAYIHISGGEWSDEYHAPAEEIKDKDKNTYICIEPSSCIRMNGDEDNEALFEVNPDQIIIGSDWGKVISRDSNSLEYYRGIRNPLAFEVPGTRRATEGANDKDFYSAKIGYPDNIYKHEMTCVPASFEHPAVMMQGPTHIQLGAKGLTHINLLPAKNSVFRLEAGLEERGAIYTEFRGDYDSSSIIRYAAGEKSENLLMYQPDYGSKTSIAIEPSGITAIQIDPIETFGVAISPKDTDITCQWDKFIGIYAGNDSFVQIDGNTHLESWSGTVVLRGSGLNFVNGFTGNDNKYYPVLKNGIQIERIDSTIDIYDQSSSIPLPSSIDTNHMQELLRGGAQAARNTQYWLTSYDELQSTSCHSVSRAEVYKNTITPSNIVYFSEKDQYDTTSYFSNIDSLMASTAYQSHLSYLGIDLIRKTDYSCFKREYINGQYHYTLNNIEEIKTTAPAFILQGRKPADAPFLAGTYQYSSLSKDKQLILDKYIEPVDIDNRKFQDYTITVTRQEMDLKGETLEFTFSGNFDILFYSEKYAETLDEFLSTNILTEYIKNYLGSNVTYDTSAATLTVSARGTGATSGYCTEQTYGKRKYELKNVTINGISVIVTHDLLDSEEILSGSANESYSSLSSDVQNYIYSWLKENLNITNWKWNTRSGQTGTYSNNNYVYSAVNYTNYATKEGHLGKSWFGPIQTSERIGVKPWDQSAIIQTYGPANIIIREDWKAHAQADTYTLPFTPTETYNLSNQKESIALLLNGADTPTFMDMVSSVCGITKELWYVKSMAVNSSDNTKLDVTFIIKPIGWKEYVDSYATAPTVEITDNSELRLHGGAVIKAETEYGETTFTFYSANSNETPVSFTMQDLQALRAIIDGGSSELPDAENSEF